MNISLGDRELKIGVFICACGGNISNVVDINKVAEEIKQLEGVAIAKTYEFLCSKPGQELIEEECKKNNVDRLIIAACTENMHIKTFRELASRTGINPYQVLRVNLREHNSWTLEDKEEATAKAISMIASAVESIKFMEPLQPLKSEVKRGALVVGGGIAGITVALELANSGIDVTLVEAKPSIGGHMAQLNKTFPTLDCAQCILTPKMVDVASHPKIKLYTYSEVKDVQGSPGNYHVKIFMKPRGVDPEKCVGCGLCSEKCPTKAPDEFNEGLSQRKAIYKPFPQAVPAIYTIDFSICKKCGLCAKACPRGAINLEDKGKDIELDVGAIILATGFDLLDLRRYEEWGYGRYPDVITSLQLERLISPTGPTGGALLRPSNGQPVNRIVFILCAGSRDTSGRGVPYCSKVCCMYSMKNAILIKEFMSSIDIWIFYIDVRAAGKGYEEFYEKSRKEGVNFVRGKIGEVQYNPSTGKLIVRAEDTLLCRPIELEADLVVLCPAIVPSKSGLELMEKLKIPLSEDGFIQEKHPKIDPVATLKEGVYVCGCASGPKDIRESVIEAQAAAKRALELLASDYITIEPEKALIDESRCDNCGACIGSCPYGAITSQEGIVKIDLISCTGCGACIPVCPKDAIELMHFSRRMLKAMIDGAISKAKFKPVVLAFIEKKIAYSAMDQVGLNRLKYPYNVIPIYVPSTAYLKLEDLIYAFSKGVDAIALLEGRPELIELMKGRVREFQDKLEEIGIESMRLWFTDAPVPSFRKLRDFFEQLKTMAEDLGPPPEIEAIPSEVESHG
ncbi:MAG: disulfide reductase [Thermoprotei archaeon]|nr:MAG: disulfide reductase [Thermoprotei archaeon]